MRAAATSMICVVFMLSTAAGAAEQPTRSVDDYICAFAGKCGTPQDEPEASIEAPETRGFRLIRPNAGTAGGKTPAGAKAGPAASAARQGPRLSSQTRLRRTAPAAVAGRALAAVAERRADLRLSFETGSATLTPRARAEAMIFGKSLLHPALAGKRFLIEGHTDSVGGRAYNLDLSQRRAAAVADYLASLGVDRGRLVPRGFGFDRPLSGRSAQAPENRRVEALLVKN
jgi:outer membrane protein OmpA-like peptidoglycan-associated protein